MLTQRGTQIFHGALQRLSFRFSKLGWCGPCLALSRRNLKQRPPKFKNEINRAFTWEFTALNLFPLFFCDWPAARDSEDIHNSGTISLVLGLQLSFFMIALLHRHTMFTWRAFVHLLVTVLVFLFTKNPGCHKMSSSVFRCLRALIFILWPLALIRSRDHARTVRMSSRWPFVIYRSKYSQQRISPENFVKSRSVISLKETFSLEYHIA